MAKIRLQGVRRSTIAGSWYPGRHQSLATTVDGLLEQVEAETIPGEIIGLIAPHAGYIYSGQVAAHAYKQLLNRQSSYDTVVIVGPSHRLYLEGFGVTAVESFETPLGQVPLDKEVLEVLGDELGMLMFLSRDEEHSLEIQLPFLQRTLEEFRLVPIMMGDQSMPTCEELGQVLGRVLKGRRALLVASTDLSHYKDYESAIVLDRLALERIGEFDPVGLGDLLSRGKTEACGGGPVMATMIAAQALGADRSNVLKYANSGDVTGDRSQVVGYMAAALYRSESGPAQA